MDALAIVLRELKLDNAFVGIESNYLTSKYRDWLIQQCPKLHLGQAQKLFAQVRGIKTPQERQQITSASHATETSFHPAFTDTKVGDTEKELARRMADDLMCTASSSICAAPDAPAKSCMPKQKKCSGPRLSISSSAQRTQHWPEST